MFKQLIEQPTAAEAVKRPKRDWAFTTEYLPHDPNSAVVTAVTTAQLDGDKAIQQFIVAQGGVIPKGYRARLVEMRHQTAGWTRDNKEDAAITKPVFFYRFAIEPITNVRNIEELLKHIQKKPAPRSTNDSPTVFTFAAGDLQLGKCDGDGTKGIIDTYNASVQAAVKLWRKAGKPRVQIAFAGDCIEGNVSQNGRNMWRTELTVTEQVRVFRRLILHTIDAFIEAPTVEIDVVNGNHDQVQRFQETRADDGHATEAAIAVADAMQLNHDRYGHCRVYVPERDSDHITRTVGATVMTIAHGHQWRRGQAMQWLAGQALNMQPAAETQILLHGHEHEFGVRSRATRLILCTPALESESTWWKHKTGDQGKRGCIAFLHTAGTLEGLHLV